MKYLVRIEPLECRRLLAAAVGAARDVFEIAQLPRHASVASSQPSVASTTPANGMTGVDTRAFVSAYVNLPNVGGVIDDPAQLAANVRLFRTGDPAANPIPSKVNTTGGGDAIILTPLSSLAGNTEYTFQIDSGLTDESGAAFIAFKSNFTTGDADEVAPDPTVKFGQIPQPTASGRRFTGVTIGPDHRLYAGTMDGDIIRFDILPGGNLSTATVINVIRVKNGGATTKRIITGLRFDPASTANNLVLWVTHGDGKEEDAPDWSGKLSRLSGANLGTYQDYITNLPRSVRDHLTQQMDFNPTTGLLYISQGSNSSMGDPDNAWGLRKEHLLSAAILEVDTAALKARIDAGNGALDVQTEGVNNPYDPTASDAPVKLYATGVRNAFDLLWHSNGSLYAPTNGSAPGGNAPAGGGAPALRNVRQNQPDLLFKIRPGKYYGHPNPTRQQYVLNGGNPTSSKDIFEVPAYPSGTRPDANWDPPVYNFGDNRSPNGVIEYESNAFGGTLKGSLIVCEYSGGDDLVVLRPDSSGNVPTANVRRGMVGTTGFVDPLDLTEDVGPGNLYVVEYGANRITLLKPEAVEPAAPRNVGRAIFNDPVGGAASPVRKLRIENPNPGDFTVNGISLVGSAASMFHITTQPALPISLGPGASIEVSVVFDPPAGAPVGIVDAGLRIIPSDPILPALELSLRGLATAGTDPASEPSLQSVLDVNQLPIRTGDDNSSTPALNLPLSDPNDAADDIEGLVKAGSGPVRVEILSVFTAPATPAIRFGFYNPSNNAQTEVLTISDAQRTRAPLASGAATFDPGTGTFGLYVNSPASGTTSFTEDYRNTFEPSANLRRKVLFFPLANVDSTPVTDAYVAAFDDASGGSDYQDFVAIVRNVRPANVPPPAAQVAISLDGGSPLTNGATVDFGQVSEGQAGAERTLTVTNNGNIDLILGAVTLPTGFELVEGLSLTTLPAGASDTLRVRLTTAAPGSYDGQASIVSSDPDDATFSLRLTGTVIAGTVPPPIGKPPPVSSDLPILTANVAAGLPAVVVPGTKSAKGIVSVIVINNNYTSFSGPATLAVNATSTDVSASASGGAGENVELMRATKKLKLRPFSQKIVKLKLTVPATLSQGNKALSVAVSTADGRTDIADGPAFTVEEPIVHLAGSVPTASGVALVFGKRAKLSIPMRNDGNVPTTRSLATFEFAVFASPNDTTPIYQVSSLARVALKPGQSKIQTVSVTIPLAAFASGSYFFKVRANADLNETNGQNLVTLPFSIS